MYPEKEIPTAEYFFPRCHNGCDRHCNYGIGGATCTFIDFSERVSDPRCNFPRPLVPVSVHAPPDVTTWINATSDWLTVMRPVLGSNSLERKTQTRAPHPLPLPHSLVGRIHKRDK